MDIKQLAPGLFVGAQIGPDDVATLAAEGFTDVVCNRPDEEHAPGAGSAVISGRAAQCGLGFHYLPIRPGEPVEQQAQRLADLTSRSGAKVFAYCRSGARSTNAWVLAQAEMAKPGRPII